MSNASASKGTTTLVVDTCGIVGMVALCDLESERLIASESMPGRETQERLMGTIEGLLTAAALTLGDLRALAVVTGPGSFTGVRIGLAAVKGLAEAADLPVVAISRLAALLETGGTEAAEAWLDAGRGDLYRVVRTAVGGQLREALIPRAEALPASGPVVVAERALADLWPGTHLVSTEDFTAATIRLSSRLVREQRWADLALLDANYLRVPDAELAMRARTGA